MCLWKDGLPRNYDVSISVNADSAVSAKFVASPFYSKVLLLEK